MNIQFELACMHVEGSDMSRRRSGALWEARSDDDQVFYMTPGLVIEICISSGFSSVKSRLS